VILAGIPIRLAPRRKRLFAARVNADRLMHDLSRWTAAIVLGGLLVMLGAQLVLARRSDPCQHFDARHGVGIDEHNRLCRRRMG
jgi:hypothetical protein